MLLKSLLLLLLLSLSFLRVDWYLSLMSVIVHRLERQIHWYMWHWCGTDVVLMWYCVWMKCVDFIFFLLILEIDGGRFAPKCWLYIESVLSFNLWETRRQVIWCTSIYPPWNRSHCYSSTLIRLKRRRLVIPIKLGEWIQPGPQINMFPGSNKWKCGLV